MSVKISNSSVAPTGLIFHHPTIPCHITLLQRRDVFNLMPSNFSAKKRSIALAKESDLTCLEGLKDSGLCLGEKLTEFNFKTINVQGFLQKLKRTVEF